MDILKKFQKKFAAVHDNEEMSVAEYLDLCKADKTAYASPAERMLAAIGEPEVIDTKNNQRLSKIFSNRVIRIYPAFKDFYGTEEVIEKIVSYFRHSAQGLEESKQILYLLGPVGGGKSSIAEKLKDLMEKNPIYVIKGSPVNDDPLAIFNSSMFSEEERGELCKSYNIPERSFRSIPSPWLIQQIEDVDGDLSKFTVQKIYPSKLKQLCVAKVEPGDENNQDISSLVGKIDIHKLDEYEQNHPYAYSFSGGLNKANRGILDFAEMFKAPIKVLNPMLTATQERNYNGTEGGGGIPFDGIILAHSNESEWQAFKNNRTNEAFLDRVNLIKIPYCLRVDEEVEIYKKLLRNSSLFEAPCAPGTLEMLAQFSIMSRLFEPRNSSLYSKMRVYNGENIKDVDPKAKPLQEYKDDAGVMEGMDGISTRFAFKVLSKVFNHDSEEIGANPVHLMYILENEIINEQYNPEKEEALINFIKEDLTSKYVEFIEKELRIAFLDSYGDYGQTIFDRYVHLADAWISDSDYRDPNTNQMWDRAALNAELEKIEKPAGIANPRDFRNEVVNFVLRYKANNEGKSPRWDSFEKLRVVIEKKMFASTEELLPVISFTSKGSKQDQEKHDSFVSRMTEKGYTERMTRILVEWWMRVRKNS